MEIKVNNLIKKIINKNWTNNRMILKKKTFKNKKEKVNNKVKKVRIMNRKISKKTVIKVVLKAIILLL